MLLHKDLVIAAANGETIQWRNSSGVWSDFESPDKAIRALLVMAQTTVRIKPKERVEWLVKGVVPGRWFQHSELPIARLIKQQLKLTYEGDSDRITKVELVENTK